MPYFDWNRQFETGIPEIDTQHKKLVGYANTLFEAMRDGKGKESVATLLEELSAYAETHFSLEEKAFYKYRYSDAERHKGEHREFVAKVEEIKEALKNDEVLLSNKLLTFLVDWVRNHILFEDMRYVSTLSGKPLKYL
jgi:hemerythrin-like metal-binding protein